MKHCHGQCQIHWKYRPLCSYCRMQKCLSHGMQVEMLRGSRFGIRHIRQRTGISKSTVKTTGVMLQTCHTTQVSSVNFFWSIAKTTRFDLIENLSTLHARSVPF